MFGTTPNYSYNNTVKIGKYHAWVQFWIKLFHFTKRNNLTPQSETSYYLQRHVYKDRWTEILSPDLRKCACLCGLECQNRISAWLTDAQINGSLANCSISIITLLISTETTMIILSINRPAAEGVRLRTSSMRDYERTREPDAFFWTPGNSKVGYRITYSDFSSIKAFTVTATIWSHDCVSKCKN